MFFRTMSDVNRYAQDYNVPPVDVMLLGLNLMGVGGFDPKISPRGRFRMVPMMFNWPFFFAITINPESPFFHDGRQVWLGSNLIGEATPITPDTCSETYYRKGGRVITLNSNSRSSCRGCQFCGTFSLIPDDFSDLLQEENLRRKAQTLLDDGTMTDYRQIESIGVVTGCFRDEQECLNHLLMVNRVFGELGFSGEVRYLGSQITKRESLETLSSAGTFAIYLTVECFDRRELIMKKKKSRVTLEWGREILGLAKELGMDTSMLYVLGLDSLESTAREFPKYRTVLTRHPLINVYQLYQPWQMRLRHSSAQTLDYYLQAREILEAAFSEGSWPFGYDNYRSLWYTQYDGVAIQNPI